jgi:hypothetical protein
MLFCSRTRCTLCPIILLRFNLLFTAERDVDQQDNELDPIDRSFVFINDQRSSSNRQ